MASLSDPTGAQFARDSILRRHLPPEIRDAILRDRGSNFLEAVSRAALVPRCTERVFAIFERLMPEICSRWITIAQNASIPETVAIVSGLAKILPFARYLSSATCQLFSGGRLGMLATETLEGDELAVLLLASFRLLSTEPEIFSDVIKPTFLSGLLSHNSTLIRFLAIQCLCIVMRFADAFEAKLIQNYVGDVAVSGAWEDKQIDYRLLKLMEEMRWAELTESLKTLRQSLSSTTVIDLSRNRFTDMDLKPNSASLAGVLVLRDGPLEHATSSFIQTPTASRNLQTLAKSLLHQKPVLLMGSGGSGKSALVRESARILNTLSPMVTLHLNEQTDAKSLLGLYTSSSTGDAFVWQPGVLTKAIQQGRWVLIEDIDKAPSEVLGVLRPIIENGELFLPSRKESIRPKEGFRIIATTKTSAKVGKANSGRHTWLTSERLWNVCRVDELVDDEIEDVLSRRYPNLGSMLPPIIQAHNMIHDAYQNDMLFRAVQGRLPSLRDLFKWCRRTSRRLGSQWTVSASSGIPERVQTDFFKDGIDCYAAYHSDPLVYCAIAAHVGQALNIPPQQVEHLLKSADFSVEQGEDSVRVGRTTMLRNAARRQNLRNRSTFALTRQSGRLLDSVAAAINNSEPILLVGETGVGKTSQVQHVADLVNQKLTVVNLSQQSEAADLLGGLKPVTTRSLLIPLVDQFNSLFDDTFSSKRNEKFQIAISKAIVKENWTRLVLLWEEAVQMARNSLDKPFKISEVEGEAQSSKRRKLASKYGPLRDRWSDFSSRLAQIRAQVERGDTKQLFAFVEGRLVQAVRGGEWLLLDEINLASAETLDNIVSLLSDGNSDQPSLLLTEAGQIEQVKAHPDFRIFAAMNPATDTGKKDLAPGIRSRFTELYVSAGDDNVSDLVKIIEKFLGPALSSDKRAALDLATAYVLLNRLKAEHKLTDGAGETPHYSIRSLVRCLLYVAQYAPSHGLRRSMYEGFAMSFFTVLSIESERLVLPLVSPHLLSSIRNAKGFLSQQLSIQFSDTEYVSFRHHLVRRGADSPDLQPHYIRTPSVERNLLNLARAASMRRFPILLQGPTSAGKTSMVEYLAKFSGNRFVRINNHEHTDLQEYLGSYATGDDGRLEFREGVLVEALRKGHWIVLDELNLAPSDVLEALNRLLDDNRELLIPESQEVVRPHSNFMLFATQNPAGLYGGRKRLSRAFRNRFLELHFDDIPEDELEIILRERAQIAPSFCGQIVQVYKKLSLQRQSTRLFESRNSFATLRDLFRWAARPVHDRQQLAQQGFMLLAERVREATERSLVKRTIEETLKVSIDEQSLYSTNCVANLQLSNMNIVWTPAMRRLFVLVSEALKNNEPVLLVGETGCGKTQICQVIAQAFGRELNIYNAHSSTETGDLIGSQRPIRQRSELAAAVLSSFSELYASSGQKEAIENQDLNELIESFAAMDTSNLAPEAVEQTKRSINAYQSLFAWNDGSLVRAMKSGDYFLLDEISLADDSVLERLNSVLEPSRTIVLAEKGSVDNLVVASSTFQFLATMNPGGDYGKRELSAALRNRLTEIWVPPLSEAEDLLPILCDRLGKSNHRFAQAMLEFAIWFKEELQGSTTSTIPLRSLLTWAGFIQKRDEMTADLAFLHGAYMVYIDSLGANPAGLVATTADDVNSSRRACLEKLQSLSKLDVFKIYGEIPQLRLSTDKFTLGQFALPRKVEATAVSQLILEVPTTLRNCMKVVRALRMNRPILLEGNPGVGKTAIITELAALVGKTLTRINLSDQTDLMDLFGADAPSENEKLGRFSWRDGPLLRAMQTGGWVLLDEMNLASQSVLEGLNSCLDHRHEVYIAELDRSFVCHPEFTLFAAQNPHHQGGGRKGLPASFVNRFTVVYTDPFERADMILICKRTRPNVPEQQLSAVVDTVYRGQKLINQSPVFINGGPWELNLRDVNRWLDLAQEYHASSPASYFDTVVSSRFRSETAVSLLNEARERSLCDNTKPDLYHNLSQEIFQLDTSFLVRNVHSQHVLMQRPIPSTCLPHAKSVIVALNQSWPILLVGSSGSGKTTLIRTLAALSGAKLIELSMNNDMDTMDLVGGFEQYDTRRDLLAAQAICCDILTKLIRKQILSRKSSDDVVALAQAYERCKSKDIDSQSLANLVNGLSPQYPSFEAVRVQLSGMVSDSDASRFVWNDGILLDAVRNGWWLVLDNANLCNPSVLDRLNSLLEPGGGLAISEQHTDGGEERFVRPHPQFRIFLTMNPGYGELSRAMRNRSLEIFMNGASQLENPFATPSYLTSASVYRLRYLFQQGSRQMTSSHITNSSDPCLGLLSPREIKLIKEQLTSFTDFDISVNKVQAGIESFLSLPTAMRSIWPQLLAEIKNDDKSRLASQLQLINSQDLPQTFAFNSALACLISSESNLSFHLKLYARQYFYELERVQVLHLMNASIEAAANLNKTEMTVLQKSKYSDRHASLSVAPNSVPQVHGFLTTLIAQYLKTSSPLPSESSVTYLSCLVALCKDILEFFSERTFEPAVFQAYIQVGKRMLRESPLSEPGLREGLRAALSKFDASFALNSGQSLQRMWPTWKPETPPSWKQLEAQISIENLLKRFDGLAKSSKLRRSDLSLVRFQLDDALSQIKLSDSSITLTPLTEAVEALSDRMDAHSSQNGKLSWVFDQLLPRLIIQGKKLAELDLHRFSLFASRPPVAFEQQSRYEIPHILRRLAYYAGSFPDETSSVGTRLKSDLENLTNQSLGTFVSTKEELGEVTSFLSAYNFDLRADLVPCILGHALKLVSSILICHEDFMVEEAHACYATDDGMDFVKLDSLGQSAIKEIDSSEVGHFRDNYVMYLLPVFALLSQSDRLSHYLAGMTLMYTCAAALKFIVPDKLYDPAILPTLIKQRHQKRQNELRRHIVTYQDLQTRFAGQGRNTAISIFEEDLQRLGQVPMTPTVFRPRSSNLHIVQAEFSNLIRSLLDTSYLSTIFAVAEVGQVGPSEIKSATESIQAICSRMASRLLSLDRAYDDVTKPVCWLVESLSLGTKILKWDMAAAAEAPAMSLSSYVPLLGGTPVAAMNYIPKTLLRNKQVDMHWLDHLQFCSRLEANDGRSPDTILEKYLSLTDKLYIEWKTHLSKDQAIAEANSRYYTYRGEFEDTQEVELSDVMMMFPTYESDEDNDRKGADSTSFDTRETAIRLAQIHCKLSQVDNRQERLSEYILRSLQVLKGPENGANDLSADNLMPGIFLQMEKVSLDLNRSISAQGINIYCESDSVESQKLVNLIYKVESRFTEITQRWPEHATPVEVLAYIDEMLAFKIKEPIAKLLTKTEKLLEIVAQWQSIASREWSAATIIADLTDLIIHWRRLELQSWSKLLEIERRKADEDANSWYFVAYEAVLYNSCLVIEQGDDVEIYCQELAKTLEGFLSTTTFGQFRSRLQLLQAFSQTLYDLSTRDNRMRQVYECLSSILFHYQRYDTHIQSTLTSGHDRLEKDILEQIKLASWKDTNIQSLRDSARRSHFKLFKIVKKYRALLAQPITSFVASGPQSVISTSKQDLHLSQVDADRLQQAQRKCKAEIGDWTSRPDRLTNPVGASMSIKRLYGVNSKQFSVFEEIAAFHTDVAASIKDLRKQTPQTLTEENTGLVRHLRERKRRLLADTLRNVAHMGVRRNLAVGELNKQSSTSMILSASPDLDLNSSNLEMTQSANAAFHEMLDTMSGVRKVAIDHSDDLTDGETRRAVGLLEGLLSIQIAQRDDLHKAARLLFLLQEVIQSSKNMQHFTSGSIKQSDQQHSSRRLWLEKALAWLPSVLEASCQVLRFQSASGKFDVTDLISELEEFQQQFTSTRIELQSSPVLPKGLTATCVEGMLAAAESRLKTFATSLKEWQRSEPNVAYLLEQIVPWTNRPDTYNGSTNGITITTYEKVDASLRTLLESIFVAMQKLTPIQQGNPDSPEDQGWLARADKAFRESVKSAHLDSITYQLQEVLSLLQHVSPDGFNLSVCLLTVAVPVVDQFYLAARHFYEKQLQTHLETARLGAFLSESFVSLAKEGFCSPHGPSDGQDEQSGKLESGTGLGEGEGAEDISKDIGQDEDLSELAQANTEKQDGDQEIDKEQDAVDMGADDLEGEMGSEDEKEGGDEKGDEQSGSDSGDEVDEETGSIDDLDPSAVDEKLWDDMQTEAEKESKEMKGSKQTGSKSDEQTAKQDESRNGDDNQMLDEDDTDGADSGQEELEGLKRPEAENLDPHLQEEQALELPEELQLNGEEDAKDDEVSDDGIDEVSDIGNLDQPEPEKTENMSDVDEDELNRTYSDDDLREAGDDDDHEAEGKGQDDEVMEDQPNDDVQDEEQGGFDTRDNDLQYDYEAHEGGDSGVANQREDNADQDEEPNVPGQNDKQDVVNEQQKSAGNASDQQESGDMGGGAMEQGMGRESEQVRKQDDALKRLADIIEQFHQRREILTASDERKQGDLDQDVDMGDADFEHLGDEEQKADAQALGAANADQVQNIDETKAIESQAANDDQDLPMPEDTETQNAEPSETIVERFSRLKAQPAEPNESSSNALLPDVNSHKGQQQLRADAEMLEEEQSPGDVDVDIRQDQPIESPPTSSSDAMVLWSHCSKQTHTLSLLLTEQLRLILAPTMATKLRGDFRTGKRLNIKRIIPYIASGYKRDKIWMRRSVPSKRNYQIMIAVDDSKSMSESGADILAFETLAMLCKSLSMLEVGEICVVNFGDQDRIRIAHPFGRPFTGAESGVDVFRSFSFQQRGTDVRKLLQQSLAIFGDARLRSSGGDDLWQLQLIVSDGHCSDHDEIRRLVRAAHEQKIMIVFVIVDAGRDSIVDLKEAVFERVDPNDDRSEMKVRTKRYLESFPFGYYVVVREVADLPGVLARVLRGWFEGVVNVG